MGSNPAQGFSSKKSSVESQFLCHIWVLHIMSGALLAENLQGNFICIKIQFRPVCAPCKRGTGTCSLVAKSRIYSVTVCRIRIPFAFSPQPGRRYIRIWGRFWDWCTVGEGHSSKLGIKSSVLAIFAFCHLVPPTFWADFKSNLLLFPPPKVVESQNWLQILMYRLLGCGENANRIQIRQTV